VDLRKWNVCSLLLCCSAFSFDHFSCTQQAWWHTCDVICYHCQLCVHRGYLVAEYLYIYVCVLMDVFVWRVFFYLLSECTMFVQWLVVCRGSGWRVIDCYWLTFCCLFAVYMFVVTWVSGTYEQHVHVFTVLLGSNPRLYRAVLHLKSVTDSIVSWVPLCRWHWCQPMPISNVIVVLLVSEDSSVRKHRNIYIYIYILVL